MHCRYHKLHCRHRKPDDVGYKHDVQFGRGHMRNGDFEEIEQGLDHLFVTYRIYYIHIFMVKALLIVNATFKSRVIYEEIEKMIERRIFA